MVERIIWTKKLHSAGGSLKVIIPIEVVKALGFEEGKLVSMCLETGKHGPYMALWKEEKVK